eukprot:CAMPEP_0119415002 /NCGR_PEP_ID=MMETSP1335-20130426/7427_1 /TAXON_ID=259385 /ORGANISM="Chrysoculter rhomboideus, Strain RCC1486" /LENGTH=200 /DNA_ID=CAMNT_0007439907 /DNA_START=42 /DNA_END=644 /DNA_ORIENTATION=+
MAVNKTVVAGGVACVLVVALCLTLGLVFGLKGGDPAGTALIATVSGKQAVLGCSGDAKGLLQVSMCVGQITQYGKQEKDFDAQAATQAMLEKKDKYRGAIEDVIGPQSSDNDCVKLMLDKTFGTAPGDVKADPDSLGNDKEVDYSQNKVILFMWTQCSKGVQSCWGAFQQKKDECGALPAFAGGALESFAGSSSKEMGLN